MKKVIIEFNAEMWEATLQDESLPFKSTNTYEKMCAWCYKNNFEIIEVIENED